MELMQLDPTWIYGRDGAGPVAGCGVRVVTGGERRPVPGATVSFRVVHGPATLGAAGTARLNVVTDADGVARVPVALVASGCAKLAANLPRQRHRSVYFRALTTGVTAKLCLRCPIQIPADPGDLTVAIRALDWTGAPVTGARLSIEANRSSDRSVGGAVGEIGNGEYEGQLVVHEAGSWALVVSDEDTAVSAGAIFHVLAGEPAGIRVVNDPDPRAASPYDSLELTAALEDRFGNALDPWRLRWQVDGAERATERYDCDTASITLTSSTIAKPRVRISDADSPVQTDLEVLFAAVWPGNPGVIDAGDDFSVPIYLAFPPDRSISRAVLYLRCDPETCAIRDFSVTLAPELGTVTRDAPAPGQITLTAEFSSPVSAADDPDGLAVGDLLCTCLSEDDACFAMWATMSDATDEYKKCFKQKRFGRLCLCVNFIYQKGDSTAVSAVNEAKLKIPEVLNITSTVENCCPRSLKFDWHTTELAGEQWDKLTADMPTRWVKTTTTIDKMFASGIGKMADCINFYLLDMDIDSGNPEIGKYIGWGGNGFASADIGSVDHPDTRNVVVHELCHALGLSHEDPPGMQVPKGNLMYPVIDPNNVNLTKTQCKILSENLDTYKCK